VTQRQRHLKALLWGSVGTSLSFFLASFQVHEKSILLPLAPLSLLINEAPLFITWFSLVATWTLWHLLQIDCLQLAYVCVSVVFSFLCFASSGGIYSTMKRKKDRWSLASRGGNFFVKCIVPVSFVLMAGLHLTEMVLSPPRHMPDIFPVLWVIAGCIFFSLSWIGALYFFWLDLYSDVRKVKGTGRSKQD